MKKRSDYDSKEISKIDSEIESGALITGGDTWESPRHYIRNSGLGLCSNCAFLKLSKSRYGKMKTACEEMELIPNTVDPIVECTQHIVKGRMPLSDMREIAYYLEIDKNKAGF